MEDYFGRTLKVGDTVLYIKRRYVNHDDWKKRGYNYIFNTGRIRRINKKSVTVKDDSLIEEFDKNHCRLNPSSCVVMSENMEMMASLGFGKWERV